MVYLLSFLSLGSTIARLVKVTQYTDRGNPLKAMKTRFDILYWTIIEIMTVIVCANLPAMPALLRYFGSSSSPASAADVDFTRKPGMLQHWFDALTLTFTTSSNNPTRPSSRLDRNVAEVAQLNLAEKDNDSDRSKSSRYHSSNDAYGAASSSTLPVAIRSDADGVEGLGRVEQKRGLVEGLHANGQNTMAAATPTAELYKRSSSSHSLTALPRVDTASGAFSQDGAFAPFSQRRQKPLASGPTD